MTLRSVSRLDYAAVAALLKANGLNPSDLAPGDLPHFLGIEKDRRIVAAGALTPLGQFGLLRSVVTSNEERGNGHARDIISALEARAVEQGVTRIYLLTETAATYFTNLGYAEEARDDVPLEIRATLQFTSLCPASARVMSKAVAS